MRARPALRDRLSRLGSGGRGVLLVAVALTVLNAVKPLHIDDPFIFRVAERAAERPLDPYGFDILWLQWPQPVHEELTPPVLPYWWAVGLRLFGDRPLLWKAWLAPFALLLAWSLHALLRRFAPGLEIPLTVLTALGPAVLPGFNFMQDVPALALALSGLELYLRAFEADRATAAAAAGLVAGLAAQTKYVAVAAIGVAVLHGLLARRPQLALLAASVATLVFFGWEWAMGAVYGEGMFLGQLRQELFWSARGDMVLPLVRTLGGTLCVVSLVGFAALGAPRWLTRGTGALVALGFGALLRAPVETPLYTVLGAGVLAVALACAVRLARGAPGPRVLDRVVLGWVAIELAVYFAAAPFPAVRRALGLTIALTVLVGRVAAHHGVPRLRGLVAAGVSLGLVVWAVDVGEARAQRDLVAASRASIDAPSEARVWFVGHWGFQHYAERAAMKPVVPDASRLAPGDWLVVPLGIDRQRIRLSTDDAASAGTVAMPARVPLGTNFGYYAGSSVLEHRRPPRLEARLYRVLREVVPETDWTPDAIADWALAATGRTAAAALPALARELGRAELPARRRVAFALSALGARAAPAVPALVRALSDPDPGVRFHAVRALGGVGAAAASAREALTALGADPDPDVRAAAAEALAALGR